MSVAGKVVEAVKSKAIRHFFLVGGCDGAKAGRNYFTNLATSIPKDCVILTLACGKYRFNKLEFGDIGGIPRHPQRGDHQFFQFRFHLRRSLCSRKQYRQQPPCHDSTPTLTRPGPCFFFVHVMSPFA
jgi:hypothetical protein